jgi:uncharacterized protein YbjT (DUF2867 family)
MTKILIVGGTGVVGREVVRSAGAKGLELRVLAREPERARALLGRGVEIVRGDLDDPASLGAALKGVRMASLAAAPAPSLPAHEGNFIEAARAAGVERIVNLSAYHVPHSPIDGWHEAGERRLRASGVPHVILRPVMFMSNFVWEAPAIKAGKIFSAFGDARMSFVDPVDVAELTIHALEAPLTGAASTWTFGGPAALTYGDVAATLTDVLGRPVEYVRVDDDAFRKSVPLPPFVIDAILATAAHARTGQLVVDDAIVREKLGRPARSFRTWVEAHREAFVA